MMKRIKRIDLWGLDHTLAKLILPYLKAFKKMKRNGIPAHLKSQKDWEKILDKMIYSMDYIAKDKWDIGEEKKGKVQEGCELFGKYFRHLWD